ncbi:hypothetical protein LTR53_015562, partial [Teratosphaeriaceae sp. CCFEE 6253]
TNGDTPALGGLFANLAFFLLQRLPFRTTYVEKVRANGGRVVKLEAQADYVIADHVRPDCPPGSLSYTFIDAAIKQSAMPDPADHLAGPQPGAIRDVGSVAVPGKHTRTPFTAEDDKVLWLWVQRAQAEGGFVKGNEIYRQLEAKNPRHTFQAWRDRYIKKLIDTPPAGVEVTVTANAPPSPPAAPDQQEDARTATPRSEPVGFRDDDFENVMVNAHDIILVGEELQDAAWAQWALGQPSHTADEWREYWENTVRPVYLKSPAYEEALRKQAEEDEGRDKGIKRAEKRRRRAEQEASLDEPGAKRRSKQASTDEPDLQPTSHSRHASFESSQVASPRSRKIKRESATPKSTPKSYGHKRPKPDFSELFAGDEDGDTPLVPSQPQGPKRKVNLDDPIDVLSSDAERAERKRAKREGRVTTPKKKGGRADRETASPRKTPSKEEPTPEFAKSNTANAAIGRAESLGWSPEDITAAEEDDGALPIDDHELPDAPAARRDNATPMDERRATDDIQARGGSAERQQRVATQVIELLSSSSNDDASALARVNTAEERPTDMGVEWQGDEVRDGDPIDAFALFTSEAHSLFERPGTRDSGRGGRRSVQRQSPHTSPAPQRASSSQQLAEMLPSDANRAAEQQLQRESRAGSEAAQRASALQLEPELPTSEANRAAGEQLRRESGEGLPDDYELGEAIEAQNITISKYLVEDGEVEDGLLGQDVLDVDGELHVDEEGDVEDGPGHLTMLEDLLTNDGGANEVSNEYGRLGSGDDDVTGFQHAEEPPQNTERPSTITEVNNHRIEADDRPDSHLVAEDYGVAGGATGGNSLEDGGGDYGQDAEHNSVSDRIRDLDAGGDALTEANLASQQAEHRAPPLRAVDLSEDDEAQDQTEFAAFLQGFEGVKALARPALTVAANVDGEEAKAVLPPDPPIEERGYAQRTDDTQEQGFGTQISAQPLAPAPPAARKPAFSSQQDDAVDHMTHTYDETYLSLCAHRPPMTAYDDLLFSSQREIEDALEASSQWPYSPRQSTKPRPATRKSQDESMQFETQIAYPKLRSQQEHEVDSEMFTTQPPQQEITYPSLPARRSQSESDAEDEVQSQMSSASYPPKARVGPVEEDRAELPEANYDDDAEDAEDPYEIDLDIPEPESGFGLSSSPAKPVPSIQDSQRQGAVMSDHGHDDDASDLPEGDERGDADSPMPGAFSHISSSPMSRDLSEAVSSEQATRRAMAKAEADRERDEWEAGEDGDIDLDVPEPSGGFDVYSSPYRPSPAQPSPRFPPAASLSIEQMREDDDLEDQAAEDAANQRDVVDISSAESSSSAYQSSESSMSQAGDYHTAKASQFETQDILDAETQQLDMNIPLPPDSDDGLSQHDYDVDTRGQDVGLPLLLESDDESDQLPSDPLRAQAQPITRPVQMPAPAAGTRASQPLQSSAKPLRPFKKSTTRKHRQTLDPSPVVLSDTQTLRIEDLDEYITSLGLRYRVTETAIIDALKATSMRPDLAELVLLEERAGRGFPTDLAGVWSAEEDGNVEGSDATLIKAAELKHGSGEVEKRLEWLREYRNAG